MGTVEYGISRTVDLSVEEAEARIRETLAERGFGILTEIDVKNTIKNKLGIEIKPYKILGACKPQLAHKALEAETEIGLLLPCNVIVYEDADGNTRIAVQNPEKALELVGNPGVNEVAAEAKIGLVAALEAV